MKRKKFELDGDQIKPKQMRMTMLSALANISKVILSHRNFIEYIPSTAVSLVQATHIYIK